MQKKDNHSDRPRLPSNQYIGFAYIEGECVFDISDYLFYIDVSLEGSNGEIVTESVYSENPFWSVSLEEGVYHIVCTADNGYVFEGDVWVE